MARARNIKPGFFKNEDLAECSPWARLCFAGLWVLADRDGRLEDRPKRIKGELFPYDSVEVEPLLRELAAHGFILRYETDGMKAIQVLEFAKHQTPHYSEKASVIKPHGFQESERHEDSKTPGNLADDDAKTPGRLQEDSRKKGGIKRGSQPPDSLIPDSPNPEEDSEAKASDAAGASSQQSVPGMEHPSAIPAMTTKDRLWALGIALLGDKARSLLGKHVATYGEAAVLESLLACNAEQPGEPRAWLTKALEARAKLPARQNGHNGHAAMTNDELVLRDPKPAWVLEAGFPNIFEAENAGCTARNFTKFRDGRRAMQ